MVSDISLLPKEILTEIFLNLPSYLEVIRLVCKLWRKIIEETHFKTIHYENAERERPEWQRFFCPGWPFKKSECDLKISHLNPLNCKMRFASSFCMPLSEALPRIDKWVGTKKVSSLFWDKKRSDIFLGYEGGKIFKYDLNEPESSPHEINVAGFPFASFCQTPEKGDLIFVSQELYFKKWSLEKKCLIFSSENPQKKYEEGSFQNFIFLHPLTEDTVILVLKQSITAYNFYKNEEVGGLVEWQFDSTLTRSVATCGSQIFCTFGTHEIFKFEIPAKKEQYADPRKKLCFVEMPLPENFKKGSVKECAICCLEVFKETLFSLSRNGSLFLIGIHDRAIRKITTPCQNPLALCINNWQIEVLSTDFTLLTFSFFPPILPHTHSKESLLQKVHKVFQRKKRANSAP